MIIPPKYSKVYVVESSSGDPHLGGPLEIRLSDEGVSIRWAGEKVWKDIAWFEVAICAEAPGQYRQIIDQWKADAFEEGMADGVDPPKTVANVLDYEEMLKVKRHVEGNNDPVPPRSA